MADTNSANAADIIKQSSIEQVIGVTEVFGDGEKVSAAILKYPKPINPRGVTTKSFQVEGKNIESVYTNDKPELTNTSVTGNYVIVKFGYENTAYDGVLSKKSKPENPPNNKQTKDAPMRSDRQPPDLSLHITQVASVIAADNTIYLANEKSVKSTSTKRPTIERFKQFQYVDPTINVSMPYNLYLPEGYNVNKINKKYPMVVFIADASANINDVKTPLFQGNGATIWTIPEEQAKHECIVLAPQYTADLVNALGMMTTDEHNWTMGLQLVTNLIFDVIGKYSVDENRIYGTGQSQGGMANIAISDKYPDLFAAQYLVACQWDVDEMSVLKDKNLWIIVCEGDRKAYPEMNDATARWESLGVKVARSEMWSPTSNKAEFAELVKSMESQGAKINYSVLKGGDHMSTWTVAYNIEGIRDWLFAQKK